MNKNILIIIAIVAVLGIGGVVLMSSMGSSKTTPTSTPSGMENHNIESSAPSSDTSSASDTVTITTESFKFSPQVIRIKAGGKITYTNKDSVAHTLTSDDGTSFDSELVEKDQTVFVPAPDTPGEYPFHCSPHPSMKGTLIVE